LLTDNNFAIEKATFRLHIKDI